MKKVHQKRPARKEPKRAYKRRPIKNALARAWRFVERAPWWSWALCSAAFIALVVVEASVVEIVRRMAGDPVTEVILVSTQLLAAMGVVIGPFAIRALPAQAKGQRQLAWRVFWGCLAFCLWSLSTTLANAQAQMTADAIRSAPTFAADGERLAALNRRIDALSDERGYDAQTAVANYIAERDVVQARLDGATPRPVIFAWANGGWVFWLKAGIFHALVAGFSAAFAVAMSKRRAHKSKRKAPTEWPFVREQAVEF